MSAASEWSGGAIEEPLGERAKAAGIRVGLASPALLWVLLIVLIPNAIMLLYSFWTNGLGTIIQEFTTKNYSQALQSNVVRALLQRTFLIAVAASLIATAIAYPLAYLIVRRAGRYKLPLALLVVVPLWVSYLMRVFAWKIILGEKGVLNGLLQQAGVIDHPIKALLYSKVTVILTLTYVAVPYVFLSIFTALERLPTALYDAAGDCGASEWSTFRDIIWPLSRPAAVIGFAIAFVITFGDYVTPALVGGLQGTMLGSIILQEFGTANNWPLGAAIAMVILVVSFVFLGAVSLLARTEAVID